MPNLAIAQATSTLQFDRQLQPDRKASLIEDLFLIASTNTVYVRQDGGWLAGVRQLTAWSLSGINFADATRNTAADGRLWVRITANAGNWDIHIYKALAAASEVATATNVAAGATATLSAANSSGIAGTVLLGAAPAAIAADTYSIVCYLGWQEYDRQIYAGQQDDGAILKQQEILNAQIADGLAAFMDRLSKSVESLEMKTQIGRIWQIPAALAFLDKETSDDSDIVTVLVDGVLERQRINWKANTTVQKVAVTTCAAGAAAYDSANQGSSSASVGTIGENIEPGLIQGVCDEDTLPGVRFSITFTPTDGTGPLAGKNKLTVGKSWDDPDIPVVITLTPGYTKTGADTVIGATSTITSIDGLTADNSDNGKLYGTTVLSGSTFIFKFYADSARTRLVAQSPAVANSTSFSATSQNKSGITVGWKSGSACADADTWTIDTHPHKKGSSTLAADSFTIAVTRSALGRLQDTARRFHNWKYNSGAAPTFPDTFLDKGSRFIDGSF